MVRNPLCLQALWHLAGKPETALHQRQRGYLGSLESASKAAPQSLALQRKRVPYVMRELVNLCKVLRPAPGTKQELSED